MRISEDQILGQKNRIYKNRFYHDTHVMDSTDKLILVQRPP